MRSVCAPVGEGGRARRLSRRDLEAVRLVVALGRRDQVDVGVEDDHRPLQIVQRRVRAPVVVRLVILEQRPVEHKPAPLPSPEEVACARGEGGGGGGGRHTARPLARPRARHLASSASLASRRTERRPSQPSEQAVPLRPREVASSAAEVWNAPAAMFRNRVRAIYISRSVRVKCRAGAGVRSRPSRRRRRCRWALLSAGSRRAPPPSAPV